jgi:hypothetical protein
MRPAHHHAHPEKRTHSPSTMSISPPGTRHRHTCTHHSQSATPHPNPYHRTPPPTPTTPHGPHNHNHHKLIPRRALPNRTIYPENLKPITCQNKFRDYPNARNGKSWRVMAAYCGCFPSDVTLRLKNAADCHVDPLGFGPRASACEADVIPLHHEARAGFARKRLP